MEFSYTPAQLELRERAAGLAEFIKQYEDDCERDNGLPAAAHAKIREQVLASGLQAVNMPSAWGGAGLTILDQVVVQEQLGELTGALWDTVWRPANALRFCTDEQRAAYLEPVIRGERRDCYAVTEPEAGSDPQSLRTTATETEGGWLINGEKWFVTVGDHADFMVLLALAGEERQPTLFLVDKQTEGITLQRTPRFMHTFVYEHPEYTFENVFVPADRVLGGLGNGYDITRAWFTEERLMIAARTIGAAERALREAREWALNRRQFGQPIADFQMIEAMLADCAVDIAVNRSFTHQVAWEADHGTDRKTVHAKASIAKLSASEAAGRVVDRCVQIFGGRGYDRSFAVERLYRELRVDRIWEGTSEVQRLVISNELKKRGTDFLQFPRQREAGEE
ncbi:acyl-CoA dehydrogenase family protein [Streptacidiphilus rugosus]|uniref:acyl-CoA dehydrogenase family protein n=1 Tax=Streptacidiphilus rugosus TaxID=405783 RepID=UPI0005646FB1|nr:acyl-CoA dehydrogenase family protein [Streptacidiphilus rugosus]